MPPVRRPIEADDLFRFKWIVGGALSPDGRRGVVAVARVDAQSQRETIQLWIVDTDGDGAPTPLTDGAGIDLHPVWSPDGATLAYIGSREGHPLQVHTIDASGGIPVARTRFAQGVAGAPAWSPDGTTIAFTAIPDRPPRDTSLPYRIDRAVYRFDGLGFLDDSAQSLHVIDATGGEPRRLTADRAMHTDARWSPDGRSILVLRSKDAEDLGELLVGLRIVDATTGATRDPLPSGWGVSWATWGRDSESIVFSGQPDGLPGGTKQDLWVLKLIDGSKPECRTAGLAVGVGGYLQLDVPLANSPPRFRIAPDRRSVLCHVQEGGDHSIRRIALNGPESIEPIVGGARHCVLFGAAGGRILFAVSEPLTPHELAAADLDGYAERRLTGFNDDVLASLATPTVEPVRFAGVDGVEVEAWFIRPPTGEAPFATYLDIHGGPHTAWGNVFNLDAHLLAGAGYAVLAINYRGSTGYGDAFATAIAGDWGALDYADLMNGVDEVIARGWADPKRLAVGGISAGGTLACWIVGHTDRFAAAIPQNPMVSWQSFYGVSDVGVRFAVSELGGQPWEIPEIYERCSAITTAHLTTTPTLLIQSEQDWRCPPEQSEQFYARLRAVGCTAEMLRLPGAAHTAMTRGPVPARLAQNAAVLDWLARYLSPEQPS